MKMNSLWQPQATVRITVSTLQLIQKKGHRYARLLHTRSTFTKSLMVSVGVSALGRTAIHFVEPGVKANGQQYRDVLMMQGLLHLAYCLICLNNCIEIFFSSLNAIFVNNRLLPEMLQKFDY